MIRRIPQDPKTTHEISNALLDAFKGKDEEFRLIGEKIFINIIRLSVEGINTTTTDNGDGTFTHTFDFTKGQ